ncbi:Transcription factor grauzone [Pseudolycoriella hygida]|uniref:Transcription factor grauzone n=1 Tax=Pseudolycoriella hygida TaxID=35572 RepID=A0A9Q0S6Y5_9DIPT|nr:Transcription factor grauzone [Pseudolycoriella hygida]
MDNKQVDFPNEINVSNICFLCFKNDDNLLETFGERGIELNIAAILHKHFWFEVSAKDGTNVCEKCWEKVESFDNFYRSVKSIHQERLTDESKSIDINEPIPLLELVKVEAIEPDIDIKQDLDDASDNGFDATTDVMQTNELEEYYADSSNETKHKDSIRRPKRRKTVSTSNSTEILPKKCRTDSSLVSKYFNMSCDLCEETLSSLRDANNHYKDVHNMQKGYLICCSKKFYRLQNMLQHCQWHINPESFKCDHCPKNFSDKYRLRDHVNLCHSDENDKIFTCTECDKTFSKQHYLNAHLKKGHNTKAADEKPARKPRINCDKEHEMIRNRFLMQCDLCGEPYSIFRDAQLHHLESHNQAGYLYCCDRKFFKMSRAIQHCVWHDDPESFKCTTCQKRFTDKISLRDHIRNVHAPDEERQFQCEICKKNFAKSYILRSHMKVNHVKDEDKNFECHICGLRFVIISFLKRHINRVHRKIHTHICELCAKTFKSGKSYERHFTNFHSDISQKVQCDMCGKWLKHKDSLKKHIIWHNSKTATCGVCGRVSSNIRALRAHMQSAHREASLECTICGKMFKKQQVLKEHMAIHAGITDLYTCTFCTKTFRSNSNMYSHRKRAHPIELEQMKSATPVVT